MKIEVVKKETAFKPVTLTITIETEQEFCDLYIRTCQSPYNANRSGIKMKHEACHIENSIAHVLSDLLNNEYKYLKK